MPAKKSTNEEAERKPRDDDERAADNLIRSLTAAREALSDPKRAAAARALIRGIEQARVAKLRPSREYRRWVLVAALIEANWLGTMKPKGGKERQPPPALRVHVARVFIRQWLPIGVDKITDDTLRSAIEAWPTRGKTLWTPKSRERVGAINALARELECDGKGLRVEVDAMLRRMRAARDERLKKSTDP